MDEGGFDHDGAEGEKREEECIGFAAEECECGCDERGGDGALPVNQAAAMLDEAVGACWREGGHREAVLVDSGDDSEGCGRLARENWGGEDFGM